MPGATLTYFHLVYAQAMAWANEESEVAEKVRARQRLIAQWHMFSEVEQIECLLLSESVSAHDREVIAGAARIIAHRPDPASEYESLMQAAATLECEELAFALTRYLERAYDFAQHTLRLDSA